MSSSSNQLPAYCIQDLTLDLMCKLLAYMTPSENQALARTCKWQQLALYTFLQWQEGGDNALCGHEEQQPFTSSNVRPCFLAPKAHKETVALASYPRSGNSLLRNMIEAVSCIVSGSDTRPDRILSRSLLREGLKGEGIVDERVCVVKTHWPERYGYKTFNADRVILVVRNPYDAIFSYFNMGMTNTHDKMLTESSIASLRGIWEDMVKNEIRVWAEFNRWWLTRGISALVIRYEDVVVRRKEMLVRIVSFLHGVQPEVTWEDRQLMQHIDSLAAPSDKQGRCSQPTEQQTCADTKQSSRHLRYYSADLLAHISQTVQKSLQSFGYDIKDQGFSQRAQGLPAYDRCIKPADGSGKKVVVNSGRLIRRRSDKFGRSITQLRHDLTEHDRHPLPTREKQSHRP